MKTKKFFFHNGQTLVEFALLIPLFILIVMFIFDIGRGVYYYSVMYNAVREGARYAIIKDADADEIVGIQDHVLERAYGMGLERDDISVGWTDVENPPVIVTVGVVYDYHPITPIVSAFLPGNVLPLNIEAKMRLEFD